MRSMTITILSMADAAPQDFLQLLSHLRPRLHRYCARMAGSALDGEDIVQEALAKAAVHYDPAVVERPQAWMFRIAHNATLDFLRRRSLERSVFVDVDGEADTVHEEATDPQAQIETTTAALASFMELPPAQRSAVILADVLDHALQEIADLLDTTVPAVKALLHRGRTRLRELGRRGNPSLPAALSPQAWEMTHLYANRLNARDFDGLRALLLEDVRLQLAGRANMQGKGEVSGYFANYAKLQRFHAEPAAIEGQPGLWMRDDDVGQNPYAILLGWRDERLEWIRDFRYARYVTEALRHSGHR